MEQKFKCVKHTHNSIEDKCVLTMSFNRMYEGNCYNNYSINNNLEIRAQGLSNNQMLESTYAMSCHSIMKLASNNGQKLLFLSSNLR